MYTVIIVFVVIFAIIIWHVKRKYGMDFWDVILALVFAVTIATLSSVPLLIIGMNVDQDQKHVLKLYSMSDGTSIHGKFFLGSGSVNEEPAFFYYVKRGDSFTFETHAAADSTVKIGKPRIEYFCNDKQLGKWLLYEGCRPGQEHFTFYVPEGSIKTQFELDAQ